MQTVIYTHPFAFTAKQGLNNKFSPTIDSSTKYTILKTLPVPLSNSKIQLLEQRPII
jgi:hypothetical protein